jgi:hypothetical protein
MADWEIQKIIPIQVSRLINNSISILWKLSNGYLKPGYHLHDSLLKRRYYPVSFGSMRDAKFNTKKNPHMSVMVVRSGPDARAGSVRIPH